MGVPISVFIAVGSNVEPEKNILRALDLLDDAGLTVESSSTFYRTEPIDRPEQPRYRNGVWRVWTAVPVRRLQFDVLRGIETTLGRVRTEDPYAPRPLDLDVIIYGDAVVRDEDLVLPDPDIYTRAFLAGPLTELAPSLRLPDSGRLVRELEATAQARTLEPDEKLTSAIRNRIGG